MSLRSVVLLLFLYPRSTQPCVTDACALFPDCFHINTWTKVSFSFMKWPDFSAALTSRPRIPSLVILYEFSLGYHRRRLVRRAPAAGYRFRADFSTSRAHCSKVSLTHFDRSFNWARNTCSNCISYADHKEESKGGTLKLFPSPSS